MYGRGYRFDSCRGLVITIAFDVDGCLIDENDEPRADVVAALVQLSWLPGIYIIVWSGCGRDYARMIGQRIGVDEHVRQYASKLDGMRPDITFDDQPVNLGAVNIQV